MARIEVKDKPIDVHSIPDGRVLLQVAWKVDGQLYVKQAVGDARTLIHDMTLRSRLIWNFVAAWISMMAATYHVEMADIETDPDAKKSALVGPDGGAIPALGGTDGGRGSSEPEPS